LREGRKTSLTRRLIGGVLLAELLCAATFSGVAILHEARGHERAFDVMLRGRADSLLGAVQDAEDPEDNVTVDPQELVLPRNDVYEVLTPGGRVLGGTPGLGTELLGALGGRKQDGYWSFRVGRTRYRGLRMRGVRVIDREEHGGLRREVSVVYAAPTRVLWHQTIEAARFYVLASVLLLTATGVVLAWFLRRWLAPLRELAGEAAGVSAHSWEFVPPAGVLRIAELEPIARSIKALLEKLRQSFERQRRLTGDAAHELKTSIAVVKSSVQLLGMARRTSEQYEAGLEELLVDTERMEALANRMLMIARLEETPVEVGSRTDLAEAMRVVADRLRPVAALRGVELAVRGDEAQVAMQADDAEVLCSNLMMNALQHSGQGLRVGVTVEGTDGVARLVVVDEGDGIREAALPHVFERFYRADSSRSRQSGGTGLGLAMCKAIVERSHGRIAIESVPGAGTRVAVTLPRV
jgi:signal transduction histidine kinase